VKQRLAVLIGSSAVLWLVLGFPARLLWGDSALAFAAAALLVCLLPTTLTLVWSYKALHGGAPEQQLLAILGSTGLRMMFVLCAGMTLFYAVPYFHETAFWLWVVVFYLFTLALEIALLVNRPTSHNSGKVAEGSF
jgi:hypothetical protein